MFLISAMPISSASDGSDHGDQDLMPAQDVVAIFDPANEVLEHLGEAPVAKHDVALEGAHLR